MKSFIISLALVLCCCSTIRTQNAENLFKHFAKEKNVETVDIGKLAMTFVKPFVGELKGVASIQVLNLEECAADVKQKFSEEIAKLKKGGYEVLLKATDDRYNVQILLKSDKDKIRELLIVTTGKESAMVRITGKIDRSGIQGLIDKY